MLLYNHYRNINVNSYSTIKFTQANTSNYLQHKGQVKSQILLYFQKTGRQLNYSAHNVFRYRVTNKDVNEAK